VIVFDPVIVGRVLRTVLFRGTALCRHGCVMAAPRKARRCRRDASIMKTIATRLCTSTPRFLSFAVVPVASSAKWCDYQYHFCRYSVLVEK
jgi:hypothetical protein